MIPLFDLFKWFRDDFLRMKRLNEQRSLATQYPPRGTEVHVLLLFLILIDFLQCLPTLIYPKDHRRPLGFFRG